MVVIFADDAMKVREGRIGVRNESKRETGRWEKRPVFGDRHESI